MSVLSFRYFSTARRGMVECAAVLPIEKPQSAQVHGASLYRSGPFKTLYLLHGYSSDQKDWLLRFRLEEWALAHGYAVIMPYGGNFFFLDNEDTDTLYGEHVGRELVEITRSLFPLSCKREETAIGGLSMGGYGAICNGLKYHETFGAIIALSSALLVDEISVMKPGESNMLQSYSYFRHVFGELSSLPGSEKDPKHLAQEAIDKGIQLPRLFLSCGADDILYQMNLDYHRFLESIGYPHVWREPPGTHTYDFWNQELPLALDWFRRRKSV